MIFIDLRKVCSRVSSKRYWRCGDCGDLDDEEYGMFTMGSNLV